MKILEEIEDKYNSHPRESARLLKLCFNKLWLLAILYEAIKRTFTFSIPATRSRMFIVISKYYLKKLINIYESNSKRK